MADYAGAEKIGFLLGGGAKQMKAQAFEEGRLRTAKTEDALAAARMKQLEAKSKAAQERELEGIGDVLADAGDPNAALTAAIMRAGRGNSQQMSGALLNTQEFGNRRTLSDPGASAEEQFAAGQGVQGKRINPFDTVGSGDYIDLRADDPTLNPTLLGQSNIARNESAAALNDAKRANPAAFRSPGAAGAGAGAGGAANPYGVKIPTGYIINPNFDDTQSPSAENPLVIDARKPVMGAREAVFLDRVVGGASQARADLQNVMALPLGSTSGVFGIGSRPGKSVMQATLDAARNKVSETNIRAYNESVDQLGRNLSFIESGGLAPSQAFVDSYDSMVMRPGDTELDYLRKLANIRQTIEFGLEPKLHSPRVPPEQKEYIRQVIKDVRGTIPFTVLEINRLAYGGDETVTLADLVRQTTGRTTDVDTSALQRGEFGEDQARARDPNAPQRASGELPEDGHREMGDDGIEYEYGGGPDGDRGDPNNWYPVAQ